MGIMDREMALRMRVTGPNLRAVGVPYTDAEIQGAEGSAQEQSERIAAGLKAAGATADPASEAVALTAYLQRLGTENK